MIFRKLIRWLAIRLRVFEPRVFDQCELVTYRNLDAKPLMIAIWESIRDIRRDIDPQRLEIIMGETVFCELTNNAEANKFFEFRTGPFFTIDRKFFGMKVRVYPWVSGWCVINV